MRCPHCNEIIRTHPERQAEFMEMCEQPRYSLDALIKQGALNHPSFIKWLSLWSRLIHEEVNNELLYHVHNSIRNPYSKTSNVEEGRLAIITNFADGIIDAKYVIDGLANLLSLPLDKLFDEVHKTNMAKGVKQADGTYKVIRRPDGKTLKPEGWKAPNLFKIIKDEMGENS